MQNSLLERVDLILARKTIGVCTSLALLQKYIRLVTREIQQATDDCNVDLQLK